MRTCKKVFAVIGIVIGALLALLLLVYAVLAAIGGVMYREARKYRDYAFTIPAIHSGFTPQGVTYIGDGQYITTGYHAKTDETLMYIAKDKSARRVLLGDENGKPLYGHGGGVTHAGDNVYVTNEDTLCMFSLAELLTADGKRVRPKGYVPLPVRAAFCFSDGTHLYAGEFYRKGNYETAKTHRMTTPNGDWNTALVACFDLNENGEVTQSAALVGTHTQIFPSRVISITGLVQGFAVKGDTYMLSRSYGLKNSKLEYYSSPYAAGESDVEIEGETASVPLFVLDSSNKFRTLTLPSFSEDLTVVGDRVVAMHEASCNKYFIGKLFFATKAYSFPIFAKS